MTTRVLHWWQGRAEGQLDTIVRQYREGGPSRRLARLLRVWVSAQEMVGEASVPVKRVSRYQPAGGGSGAQRSADQWVSRELSIL